MEQSGGTRHSVLTYISIILALKEVSWYRRSAFTLRALMLRVVSEPWNVVGQHHQRHPDHVEVTTARRYTVFLVDCKEAP